MSSSSLSSAQRKWDAERYKRIRDSNLYQSLASPSAASNGEMQSNTATPKNVTSLSSFKSPVDTSASPTSSSSSTAVFPPARGRILNAITPAQSAIKIKASPSPVPTTTAGMSKLKTPATTTATSPRQQPQSQHQQASRIGTPSSSSSSPRQQASRIVTPSNTRTLTSTGKKKPSRSLVSKIPSPQSNVKGIASPPPPGAAGSPKLLSSPKSPLKVPLVMPTPKGPSANKTAPSPAFPALRGAPPIASTPTPMKPVAQPAPLALSKTPTSHQKEDRANMLLLRPKQWNRDQLIAWLQLKHLLLLEQQTANTVVPMDMNGFKVMRMTISQLGETFFSKLEKPLATGRAATLYRMLRVQDDLTARMEFKQYVQLKKRRLQAQ